MKTIRSFFSETSIRFWSALVPSLLVTSGVLCGQTIPNPSFELDTFGTYPGYISVNGPITGWVGTPTDRVGVNTIAGPFVNNGAIPNGSQAAFIQSFSGGVSTLSTEITGLTFAETYQVSFRLNARTNSPVQTPVLKIGVDGHPILSLSTMGVQIGGTTTPYRYVAFRFQAGGETATLSLTNDVNGDTTVLVDDFDIEAVPGDPFPMGWSHAPWNADDSSGVGPYYHPQAYNFGGGTANDTTINGTTFRGILGGNPTVANEFRIGGVGSAFGSDDADRTITTGGSAELAKRFIYGGNSGTFSILGLVPGQKYVATFFSVGWEDGFRAQTFSYGNDRLTVNQDHYGNNRGILIRYHYIAPPSGAIMLTQTPTLPGNTMHLYGFANAELNDEMTPAPVIGVQPRSQVTTPGSTASFLVTAGGGLPTSFQWYKDDLVLADQTNRWLTISNVTAGDLGAYYVVVTNAYNLSVTSSSAGLTFGMIANPSFEADLFENWPGYVSGNRPISGWVGSDAARVGINPLADGQSPFVNSGAVPDGQQAAFFQSPGTGVTLSTPITGLTPGENYFLNFRASARDYNNTKPTLRVVIDSELIGEARLFAVGGTDPYRYIALPFTPTNETVMLTLTNDTTDAAVVDDFSVAVRTTQWSYAAWTDDASSGLDGAQGYSHAYNFGGASLAVDTTINGVGFIGVPGANPAVAGQFSAANLTGVFGADSNVLTSTSESSAALARSFVYFAGTIPGDQAQSITLSNLVPGVEYAATIYGVGFDAKSYARSATFSVGDDRLTINENHFDLDAGLRVTYRYVADASGTITLSYVPTDRASSFHTYGFSNQELTSTNAPIVYREPESRTVSGGATVVLDSLVGGQAPLFLQWQKNGVALPGQTNAVLVLTGVNGNDTGDYALVVSNAVGVVTGAVARVEVGLALANPSFEVDMFTNYPGYIEDNFPITGWASSLPIQTGINPVSDGRSPFADNGSIPDGAQVAFIQADGGGLSQVITGMTVGATYYIKFFENARGGNRPLPSLEVTLGGETIVPVHVVSAGAYQRVVSGPFLATAESAELAFLKSPGPAGGDSTVLLDSVAVLDLPPTPPTFLTQPAGAYLKEGDPLTLLAVVQGSLPMTYQWQRNEADVGGATSAVLDFPAILMSEAGDYRLIASNQHGSATSEVAVVRVGLGMAELFNTGLDVDGLPLPGAEVDPHYQLISSADSGWPGPDAVVYYDAWPIPPYLLNSTESRWISPRTNDPAGLNNQAANVVNGIYTYRTAFVLDSLDPATAEIRGKWAIDNFGVDILLNGASLGITNNGGFASFGTFTINSGFMAGLNTLDFVTTNGAPPGPAALRVELDGVAMPLPPTAPTIVSQPQSQLAQELADVTLEVLASGSPGLSYQWYFEGFPLPSGTNRVLRLNSVTQFDSQGTYWVVVTNPEGNAPSDQVVLTVNVPPFPYGDVVATAPDRPVAVPVGKLLFNDLEPDGDALFVQAVSSTSTNGGTVALADGSVTYTPPAGYAGPDEFTYTAGDDRGGRATATVQVTVADLPFLAILRTPAFANGRFTVSFAGVPNYPYTIEWAPAVDGPWTVLTTIVADGDGWFDVEEVVTEPVPPARFYRAVYP